MKQELLKVIEYYDDKFAYLNEKDTDSQFERQIIALRKSVAKNFKMDKIIAQINQSLKHLASTSS